MYKHIIGTSWHAFIAVSIFFLSSQVSAQDLFIYPAQGQSPEQQDKDKYECYNWARSNSGVDPVNQSEATAPVEKKKGGVVRGALGGAAIGAIAGDSSKAAGRGAAAGAVIGGVKQNSSNQQAVQQQGNQAAANQGNYDRAYSACLEGRGYTIK